MGYTKTTAEWLEDVQSARSSALLEALETMSRNGPDTARKKLWALLGDSERRRKDIAAEIEAADKLAARGA